MLYLIEKNLKKKRISSLKHEIILYQKEKRKRIFQVKTISKDVRKAIFLSFMFLFIYAKKIKI